MIEIKIKSLGILKMIPEENKPVNFMELVRIENRMRIVSHGLRKVENLVKLERYAEAESELNEMGDNLHMWAVNK